MRRPFPYEKVREFDRLLREAANSLGILFICDRGYLINREDGTTTSVSIMPAGDDEASDHA